ncbi:MAG: hypothetical protein RR466_05825 [Hungatella sp.]
MSKSINSVHGKLNVNCLGSTLMHEHIISVNWNMRQCYEKWFNYDEFIEYAVKDVMLAKDAGIKTLVDVTPVCLGRDIRAVAEVAQRTGMQIIAATGFFHTEQQWMFNRSIDSFLKYMMIDIEEGIDGTAIHPGVIKCCTDLQGLTPINKALLTASAIAAQKSGLPISTHASWQNKSGLMQLKLLTRHQINPSGILIGHCGDTNDISYLEELLRYGCYIGLDRFGDNAKNPLENRVDTMLRLCDKGYINQIMVSHDHVCYVDIGNNEWCSTRNTEPTDYTYNFSYFNTYVIPLLKEHGFQQHDIDQILVENPRRYFSH